MPGQLCKRKTSGALQNNLLGRIRQHLASVRGKTLAQATDYDIWFCVCLAIRELALEKMLRASGEAGAPAVGKQVHYLSLEFLIGRLLKNNVLALGLGEAWGPLFKSLQWDEEALEQLEPDAGLGNGGLGRLAACYLDSLATLGYAGVGHGLRYEHGMFRQEFDNGWQTEQPDDWLKLGNPWEIVHPEHAVSVLAYGRTTSVPRPHGGAQSVWTDWQMIEGIPYDVPVMGWGGARVNMLRLWSSRAAQGFRLEVFNRGDYVRAVEEKNWAETITKVLYPSDNTSAGRELRFLQEYFLVACSIRDMTRNFSAASRDWHRLPEAAAVQMNDTHPSLAVAELMRCLVDEEEIPWETAWDITSRTLAYTNHTLLPEALEKWPVPLFERVLPRHLQIVYEINARFLRHVAEVYPDDDARIRRMSLIEEGDVKQVRMAHLAMVGSHAVNGVAQLHSELLRRRVASDFAALWPEKFCNVTNGVTHRRWLRQCNPELAELITGRIGDGWILDADELRRLEPFGADPQFRDLVGRIKLRNKERLSRLIRERLGVAPDPASLFDVQVKRLHEYKRQMLNVLHIIALYLRLRDRPSLDMVPRTFVFGAKAAPSYAMAKLIIKLINNLSRILEADRRLRDRLRVVFIPDYKVSLAEVIIPAADLSEQISAAGTEASGTGNMKLALNGALTIGTWDGANIEIAQAVGLDHIFIFGHRAEELDALRPTYQPSEWVARDAELGAVMNALRDNTFCPDEPGLFLDIWRMLTEWGDAYFHLADFRSYVDAQARVEALYREPADWTRRAVLNVSRMGGFSSDRAIREYAGRIWNIQPVGARPERSRP